jgi:hypothetical protein
MYLDPETAAPLLSTIMALGAVQKKARWTPGVTFVLTTLSLYALMEETLPAVRPAHCARLASRGG